MTDKKDRNTEKLTDKQTMKEKAIKQRNTRRTENIRLSKGEGRPWSPSPKNETIKQTNNSEKTEKSQKVKVDLVCTIPPPPQLLWQDSHCARCSITSFFPLIQFVGFFL